MAKKTTKVNEEQVNKLKEKVKAKVEKARKETTKNPNRQDYEQITLPLNELKSVFPSFKVYVTQEIIDRAETKNGMNCMVKQAIEKTALERKDLFPMGLRNIVVDKYQIGFSNPAVGLRFVFQKFPPAVKRYIELFDKNIKPQPFKFVIDTSVKPDICLMRKDQVSTKVRKPKLRVANKGTRVKIEKTLKGKGPNLTILSNSRSGQKGATFKNKRTVIKKAHRQFGGTCFSTVEIRKVVADVVAGDKKGDLLKRIIKENPEAAREVLESLN